ncbi:hypothetical protein D3C72_1231380 [compost metagenome]
MDDAERGVAVAHFRHQHAHGTHVIDLAELQTLALHFAPDRIDVFGPAADVGIDAGGLQFVFQLAHHVADEALAIQSPLMEQLGDLLVLVRFQVTEGQVFQFPLDMTDTQAMGQWRVDVEDFTGHTVALFVVGGFHRTDRARAFGQFDQGDANVVDHGHQHLAQVFHLALGAQHQGFSRTQAVADRGHALHAVDELGHHRTEALADGRQLDLAFAHASIQDRGDQRVLVEFEIGEDLGDLKPCTESRVTFRPQILCRIGLLFGLASVLAGFFQGFAIQCQIDTDRMIEPSLEIDTAVGVDRLVCSHLYHLAYLPYDADSMRQIADLRCPCAHVGLVRGCTGGPVGPDEHPSSLQITPWPRHVPSEETYRESRHVLTGSPA